MQRPMMLIYVIIRDAPGKKAERHAQKHIRTFVAGVLIVQSPRTTNFPVETSHRSGEPLQNGHHIRLLELRLGKLSLGQGFGTAFFHFLRRHRGRLNAGGMSVRTCLAGKLDARWLPDTQSRTDSGFKKSDNQQRKQQA